MKIRLLPFLLALLLVGLQAVAAVPTKLSKAPIPAWVRSTHKQAQTPDLADISDGYYFESVDYQVNLGLQTRFYRDVKVLSDHAGTENAGQINIIFDPHYQTLVLHELIVLRDGERIDRLDIARFELMASETELARSIYNGTYSAYFLLEDLRKGDKIILSYSLRGFNPVFENKFFDSYMLESYEPIGLLHVSYMVPTDRKLSFKSFGGAASPSKETAADQTVYSWEIAGTGKNEYESNTPYWYISRPMIQCSEFASWSAVSTWAARVNPIPDLVPAGKLAQHAETLWKAAGSDEVEYAQAVTEFVQNDVRYMGVEVGEYSHRANSPEKVFAQRYGDCKDKSVLMAAMLKYKGIESELVLANSLEQYGLENYLPTPGAFNHMVLNVLVDGRGKMIDPTISNQGGAFYDRYFPFYGKVLPLNASVKLRDTEKTVAGNVRIEEKYYLQKDGTAKLDVLTIYQGADAEQMRNYFRQTAKNQIEKSYVEYYQRFYKQLAKRSKLLTEDDLVNNTFRVQEFYTIKAIAETESHTNRKYIGVYANNANNYLPEIMESRLTPLALAYPLSLEHDIYVINPDGVDVPAFKETSFVDRESYYFAKNVVNVADTLKISYRLGFHDTYVKVGNLREYYADFSNKDQFFSGVVYLKDEMFVSGSTTQYTFNPWVVLAFFLLLALFSWLTYRYYHHRQPSSLIPLYDEVRHDQIGGWLILLFIGLICLNIKVSITGIIQLFFADFTGSMADFNYDGSSAIPRVILVFEFVSNTILIFLSAYCVYLLIKRRDIFPQTLFFTLLFQMIFLVLDSLLIRYFFKEVLDVRGLVKIFPVLIYSIPCALYIFRSTRVKGTFLLRSSKIQKALADQETLPERPPGLPPLPAVQSGGSHGEQIILREDHNPT